MGFLPPPIPKNVLCQKEKEEVEERGGKNTEKWRGKWKENREGKKKREQGTLTIM